MMRHTCTLLGFATLVFTGCQQEISNEALLMAQENQRAVEQLGEDLKALQLAVDKLAARETGNNDDLLRFSELERKLSELENRQQEQAETMKATAMNASAAPMKTENDTAAEANDASGDVTEQDIVRGLKGFRRMGDGSGPFEGATPGGEDVGNMIQKLMEQAREQRNKEMGIDEYTATRLSEIEQAYRKEAGEIMDRAESAGLTEEQMKAELKTAKDASQAEVDMLLTPEQKKVYDNHGGLGGGKATVMTLEMGDTWTPAPPPENDDNK